MAITGGACIDGVDLEAGEEYDVVALSDAVIFVSSQKPTPRVE